MKKVVLAAVLGISLTSCGGYSEDVVVSSTPGVTIYRPYTYNPAIGFWGGNGGYRSGYDRHHHHHNGHYHHHHHGGHHHHHH